jgi:hypothetical protein
MTVHARRYGRWCREHFDIVDPDSAEPVEQAAGGKAAAEDETEQAMAGDVPADEPRSGKVS